MRTTVTIDDDVQKAVDALRRSHGLSTSAAVNELARRGLAAQSQESAAFTQRTSAMGTPRFALDDIGEALELLEGPEHR